MTHVYIVSRYEVSDEYLLGIYTTREMALAYYEQASKEEPRCIHDVWMVPLNGTYNEHTWQAAGMEKVTP